MKNIYKNKSLLTLVMLFSFMAFLAAQVEISPPLSFFDFENDLTDAGSEANDLSDEIIATAEFAEGGIVTGDESSTNYTISGGAANNHLILPYNAYLNAESHTFSLWVRYNVLHAWHGYLFWTNGPEFPDGETIPFERRLDLWTWGGDGPNQGIVNQLDPDGAEEQLRVIASTADYDGDNFLTDEAWHFIVVTLHNSVEIKLYIDAQLLVDTVTLDALVQNKEEDIWIGERPGGGGSIMGSIDRIRIWDEALTEEQVTALYDYEGPEGGNSDAVSWGPSAIYISNATSTLLTAFPNPTAGLTNFEFELTSGGSVNLAIHDVSGKEVAVVDDDYRMAGKHTVPFSTDKLSSGIYFVVLQSQDETSTCKLIVE